MATIRTKILYFLLPMLMLGGGIILIGSVRSENNSALKNLSTQATTISLDPPNDLNFAGEIVPLRDFDIQERLDNELIRYIYYHSATIMNIKRAARWRGQIEKILKREGVPEDFFYLCIAESHLSNATSPVGAKGFWQFMEATARSYNLEVTDQVDERYDPIKATEAACKYLKDAHRMFKNWTLVAASYNMGMGGLKKQLDKQRVESYYDLYLNAETAAYVFRILAIKTVLENPEQYGFELNKQQLYAPLSYRTVEVDTTIHDLVAFAQQHNTTYKVLRVLNPWILKDNLVVPKPTDGNPAKVYRIAIPRTSTMDESAAQEMVPHNSYDSLAVDSAKIPMPSNTAKPDGAKQGKPMEPKVKEPKVKESNNQPKKKSGGN